MTASLLVACLSLAEPSPAAAREAVVTVTVENMYAAADDATAVVSQATLGDVVEVSRRAARLLGCVRPIATWAGSRARR
jgi:hypothetical protein